MIPQVARTEPPPVPITLSRLLIAEGDTPMHLLEALLREMGLSESIEIRNFRGIRQLPVFLRALMATAGFQLVTSLGIVRDAEDSASAAEQSVEDLLRKELLTVETRPNFRSAVFILPDGKRAGMIEDLCLDAVRTEPVFACVEEFVACAEANGATLPAGLARSKAFSQAYLATKSDTQMFPGIAAYRKYWPFESAAFDNLKAFLKLL